MIRGQRKAHARIWTVIAVLLPLALLTILASAPGPVHERAPVRLPPLAPPDGGAGG